MRTTALKAARQKAGLSQVELATKLGVAPSTVAAWELGTHSIRTHRLTELARVLRVEVTKLLSI
jgi:transcriptional regulator with XRE-family HTH domain